jgi:hypothetical protein
MLAASMVRSNKAMAYVWSLCSAFGDLSSMPHVLRAAAGQNLPAEGVRLELLASTKRTLRFGRHH